MNALLLRIIVLVVTMMSPALRIIIVEFLTRLEIEAKKTDNPWDDILVAILKILIVGENK